MKIENFFLLIFAASFTQQSNRSKLKENFRLNKLKKEEKNFKSNNNIDVIFEKKIVFSESMSKITVKIF